MDFIGTAIKRTIALFKNRAESTTHKGIDEAAFKQMLGPVKENLYNFIYKALNFSEDADDVYQEAVLRAFKYRNSYNRSHSFKTWLFTIAHNEVKRYFNKHKKNRVDTVLEEHLYINDEGVNDQLVRVVYDTAQLLEPKQRRVFFLFYDQGFSIREISGITGLKEGNIKFILNQSREKIKEKLKEGGKNG